MLGEVGVRGAQRRPDMRRPARPQQLYTAVHHSSCRRHVRPLQPARYQRDAQQLEAALGADEQQDAEAQTIAAAALGVAAPVAQPAAAAGAPGTAVPRASDMQAAVTLVPKKGSGAAALLRHKPAAEDPIGRFMLKCKMAWNLFFPPSSPHEAAAHTPTLSPKELGKQRLSMILVADRCGLSPSSLVEMKRNTLAALADVMDLEDLQDANLRFTMTREGGTTYSMAVPILRPGPYSDDGSVVGQQGPGPAAAAAAAATAGLPLPEQRHGGGDYEGDEDDYFYDDDDEADAVIADGGDDDCAPEERAAYADYEESCRAQLAHKELTQQAQADVPAAAAAAALSEPGQQEELRGEAASVGGDEEVGHLQEALKGLLVEELVADGGHHAHGSAAGACCEAAAAAVDEQELLEAVWEVQRLGAADESAGGGAEEAQQPHGGFGGGEGGAADAADSGDVGSDW